MKLGIYGGTFSPPHYGHVHAALTFLDAVGLDCLKIMPANIPPHKEAASVPALDRLKMTELAFSGCPGYRSKLFVDDFEIQKSGKSYTVETLEHFAAADTELYFLCGTDMFLSLSHWYRPDRICELSTIVLLRRESDARLDGEIDDADRLIRRQFSARTLHIPVEPIEISSSEIRSAIAFGKDVSKWLSPAVLKYIQERGFYR